GRVYLAGGTIPFRAGCLQLGDTRRRRPSRYPAVGVGEARARGGNGSRSQGLVTPHGTTSLQLGQRRAGLRLFGARSGATGGRAGGNRAADGVASAVRGSL